MINFIMVVICIFSIVFVSAKIAEYLSWDEDEKEDWQYGTLEEQNSSQAGGFPGDGEMAGDGEIQGDCYGERQEGST